jgi:hypothetical protein
MTTTTTWLRTLFLVVPTYFLIFFYNPTGDVTYSIILVAILFLTGFFYLLNFTGKGAFYYLIGHALIISVIFFTGISIGVVKYVRVWVSWVLKIQQRLW